MKTSASGRRAITAREGNKLKAYVDSGGVLTIGVGHTSVAGPPKVTKGLTITAAQSDEILSRDLADTESAVNRAVKVPMSQNEFDALVSLAFNIGNGAFAKSTVVRKLNAGDRNGAAKAFLSWNKDNGQTVAGLTSRRKAESAQFLSGKLAAKPPETGVTVTVVDNRKPAPPVPAPVETPVRDDQTPILLSKYDMQIVQQELIDLGYTEVGQVDGIYGGFTRTAIRAFRADNHLPATDRIDRQFMDLLPKAEPRVIAPARAEASTSTVTTVVPEAKAHWWNKWIGYVLGAGAGGFGITDAVAPARGIVDQVRDVASDVPGWAWLLIIAVLALAIAMLARRGEAKSVEAFRDGSRR